MFITSWSKLVNKAIIFLRTLAEHFDFSLPTISKHLKELREANIVTMEKKGNKIYIEPNIETVRKLGGCFTTLVENFESNREMFFDELVLS